MMHYILEMERPAKELVALLPTDRIRQAAPFEAVGIDFAGPLYRKTTQGMNKPHHFHIYCQHKDRSDLATGDMVLLIMRINPG